MICKKCGWELEGNERFCRICGAPVEAGERDGTAEQAESGGWQESTAQAEGLPEAAIPPQGEGAQLGGGLPSGDYGGEQPAPKPKKKTGIVIGAVAAVAAAGAVAFAFLSQKDPKEVVITAFENIYPEGQTSPMEELFGISEFRKKAAASDMETSLTVILDSSSEDSLAEFEGSGLRIEAREDRTNKASYANVGVIYKDMDLANLDVYYGDETMMMAVPELSGRVFTIDLGDGLEERIESSPFVGPAIEESGIDVAGLMDYVKEVREKAEAGEQRTLDLSALMTRFQEGTQAREKFEEALVVEKGEKGTFVVNGKEASCRGYQVVVSKASMMEFLRSSRDFFLNDQELKDQYLSQLEQSVRLTELMGGVRFEISASDMYQNQMRDVTKSVDEMIDFLDKSLTDVNMDVYVDRKGRLAAMIGTTALNVEEDEEADALDITFDIRLQGGSYLTQNLLADVTLEKSGEKMKLSVDKRGTYEGKQLTSDVDLALDGGESLKAGALWTGTYDGDSGDYHVNLSVTQDDSLVLDLSMTGVVDQLEKGSSVHMDIDELRISSESPETQVVLRGEYSLEPLAEPVTALEGEAFDVLASDENQWQSVIMELYMGLMRLSNQLSL